MKNISRKSTKFFVALALLCYSMVSYGQDSYEVTYTSGVFDSENSWLLWDATVGSELLCDDAPAVPGTYSTSAPAGNAVELYAWESFGDGWNTATIALERTASTSGLPLGVLYGPDGDPGGADGNGSLNACPGGSPTDGAGGALAYREAGPAVPTMGQWGLIILGLSLGIFALLAIKNRSFSQKSVQV